ncbi:MAG: DUF4199 domain-containing protein [Flavobacteriales bacterium]|nr:DUF4199 domain-containing protein [Flavobacteriales bacterium]
MNQKAITYGVIGGLVSIAATLVMYIVNPALLASFWIMMLFIPVQIVFVVLGTIAARKNAGGYMPFGKAFLNAFVCGMVMSLLGVLFQIMLFHVIDPELPAYLMEEAMQNTAEMMSKFGMPEEAMQEAMAQAGEDIEKGFSVAGMFGNLITSVFFWGFIGLIVGLIVKRNPPEADPVV